MNILFICEYNACRSQMGEGLARSLLPKEVNIFSAGIHPGQLNGLTVDVMKEIGIDISGQKSKQLPAILPISFDHIFVLAKPAWPHMGPVLSREKHLWVFEDPVSVPGETEWLKGKVRQVRDGIRRKLEIFFGAR